MKPSVAEQFRRMREIAMHADPLNCEERAEHRAAVARVKAEDDRRRAPAPQLELAEAA